MRPMKPSLKDFPCPCADSPFECPYCSRCQDWCRDFEASLRFEVEEWDKWLMDVKNQLPCQPMLNYNWQYHAELYWENLWHILDKLKEVLGDEDR